MPEQKKKGRRRSPAARVSDDALRRFGRLLRAWYRLNARDLPWRRTRDPYAILVSELMLQQTQVLRVVPRWHEFLERFPTLHAVAAAEVTQVEEAWEGLGYYARARNLHRTARLVTRDGHDVCATLPRGATAMWTHNQALMEIGALVCTARVMRCGGCPVLGGVQHSLQDMKVEV